MKKSTFIKTSRIGAPVREVFQWHARPGALQRMSPPWDPLDVVYKSPGIDAGARTVMKIRAGILPLKIKWVAEHSRYIENELFQDFQVRGPFKHWTHTHHFTPDDDGCILEDRVEYALPFYPFGPLLGHAYIRHKLERIFRFRHETLQQDLADHLHRKSRGPLNILISGASGLVGSALVPFLTTGGHRVARLIRTGPRKTPDEFYWNPADDIIEMDGDQKFDAVIHLSGENIGEGRWTKEKKKAIIESRNKSTYLLTTRLSRMKHPPKTIICASAIGYYGHRGDDILTEEDACGADFISGVCSEWEAAAAPASEKGIRVVFLRIGVVLSPQGGALRQLLRPFRFGLGGKIGRGDQYISWIGIDDLIGAIYHVIFDEKLSGPVNVVSPKPVTNRELTETLGKVLRRPTGLSIPATFITLFYGEMGKEILLSSTRVAPKKLTASGYRFRHPTLEGALRHLLGR